MAITQANLITAAKQVAQDASATALLLASGDYDRAVDMALPTFDADRPNKRVIHHTVAASAFRFVLSGTGALAGLTGLNAWVPGRSFVRSVWWPYDTTVQGQAPLESDEWRVLDEPSLIILELLTSTPASDVLRLEFTSPHVVASDAAQTSVLLADVSALKVLVGAQIMELYAARAVQNTGSTGLSSDVVDRRSQADSARGVAKSLMARYASMVGRRPASEMGPLSAIGDMDVEFASPLGPIWPRARRF